MAAESGEQQSEQERLQLEMSIFFPIVMGVVRAPPPPRGGAGPLEPDRIVLLNPLTRGMVVLRSDGSGDEDVFSVLMRDVMNASMADGNQGPPPASKASIKAMRVVDAVKEGEECSVCLELLQQQGEGEDGGEELSVAVVKEMPCGHRYHVGCIGKWLEMHGSCPVCRYRMPEEEESTGGKKGGGGAGDGGNEDERRRTELGRGIWVTVGVGERDSSRTTRDADGEENMAAAETTQQGEE